MSQENSSPDEAVAEDSTPGAAVADESVPADREPTDSAMLGDPVDGPSPADTASASEADGNPAADPWSVAGWDGDSVFGPADAPGLLSSYIDALAISAFDPNGAVDTLTYLEDLCRAGGAPEWYCRQLYGE